MSRPVSGPNDSRSFHMAMAPPTSPMGTLIQKIQCQEMPSTMAPPITGPAATARPLMPDQMPMARPRLPGGNASASSVSDSGSTGAAPRPWRARKNMSHPMSGARAHPTDASEKMTRPAANTRRRPRRSPSAAPVRSSTENARV